ncbi:MAG: flagellar export protein FliJ [Sarcina sp.]
MEKNFNFKLEKILEIRKQKEEESARIFQKAQFEKQIVKEKLEQLETDFNKHKNISSSETVVYQKIKRLYMKNINKAIDMTKEELISKEKVAEEKRQVVLEKQIERKTVEKLKEKQYAEFIKEQYRLEGIANDEFALFGHFRKLGRG